MKHKSRTKALSWLLTLAMLLSLAPGMGLTAYANGEKAYAAYVPTENDDADALAAKVVKFNGMDWYLIEDNSTSEAEGNVTLLNADNKFGSSMFSDDNNNYSYSSSKIKTSLDAMTQEGGAFAAVKDAIADTDLADVSVTGAKLYLLSKTEATSLPVNVRKYVSSWWLRGPAQFETPGVMNGNDGNYGSSSANTQNGVRPALKLDLSKVTFDSGTKTFALAAPSTPVASVTPYNGTATEYTDFAEAVTAWNTASSNTLISNTYKAGATLKLLADVETNTSVKPNVSCSSDYPMILDLNGYGIRYTGEGNASVIYVEDRSGLNLKMTDGNPNRVHYITLDSNGRGIAVSDTTSEGAIEVTGGYITGGHGGSSYGGGVHDMCSFTMTGGTIVGNTSNNGAGVRISQSGAAFTMTGGTITGNKASTEGGGVWFGSTCVFNLSGGAITGNSAGTNGGGVCVTGAATFKLSGNAVIKDNLKGTDKDNVYLSSGRKITITDALTNSDPIGVTMQTPGVFTEGNIAKNYAANFTSDDPAYSVVVDGNELKLSLPPVAYMAWDEASKTVKAVEGGCTSYTVVTAGTDDTLTTIPEGWYVITSGEAVATQRLVVNGTVNLILCDGATLIASKGITVAEGNTLNIYAGSTGDAVLGTGKLYAGTTNGTNTTCESEYAGIGGSSGAGGGTVTIHGGEVTARGYTKAAGIGGGNNGAGGTVKIYGGTVTASCDGAVGIGAGRNGGTNGTLTLGTGMNLYGGTSANPENDLSNHVAQSNGDYARSQYMTVNNVAPHTHSFTYTASGATITATCGSHDGCPLASSDYKATLTIVAPTLTTYGQTGEGISAAATLTGLSDFNTATGKTIATTDIKYVGRDGTTYTESATAPVKGGKYTAKITVDTDKTASVDYEIAKIDQSVTAPTAKTDLIYDGTPQDLLNSSAMVTTGNYEGVREPLNKSHMLSKALSPGIF